MASKQRDLLLCARDMVKDGWCQNRLFDIRHGVVCRCVVGAIEDASTATGNRGYQKTSLVAVAYHLGLDSYLSDLADWNDHPKRTQAEVIALLESVANQEDDNE